MKPLVWVRQKGFWANDRLHGSPIRKHFEDLESNLASGKPPTDRLELLLRYAVTHAPFYSSHQKFTSLQDFPVINKSIIKAHYDAFQADSFQTARLHTQSTSGSTGTPFLVRQDPDKRRRVLAEMIYFGEKAGYRVGDRFVFTRVWTRHNRKSWFGALRENAVMFDISCLDQGCMESLKNLLSTDGSIRCLLGYPSTFEALARHLEHQGWVPESFHLRTIISISERLPPQTREALRSRFGCTVVSRYSNQENGVLAQQCPDHDEFHLNTASYAFEYLKLDEDLPANPQERARVVVTDLYNLAMPMIRYDTGDVVIRQSSAACAWTTETLGEIEGRRLDFIYDTEERLLSPVVVCNQFWPFTQLRQFQFIQIGRGRYQILLNGAKEHYQDDQFIDLSKQFLGSDASISVQHVDQIPQLASGKFKLVVNLYRPLT